MAEAISARRPIGIGLLIFGAIWAWVLSRHMPMGEFLPDPPLGHNAHPGWGGRDDPLCG
ncbi:MAG: hypothetical protein R3F11_26980 [Verrucomicrobiales bacterium]